MKAYRTMHLSQDILMPQWQHKLPILASTMAWDSVQSGHVIGRGDIIIHPAIFVLRALHGDAYIMFFTGSLEKIKR